MNRRQAAIQLNRILRDNSFDRYALSKRGSIAFERLPFYQTSKKIFKEQTATGGKHYAFVLLLDVSCSMGHLSDDYSDVTLAFNSIKNIIGLLGEFVDINVIIFGDMFYKFTQKEFSRFRKPEDLNRFVHSCYTASSYNEASNNINIKVKKNKQLANINLITQPMGIDLTGSTFEYLAFQEAINTLKNFNGKTGIISLCDGESWSYDTDNFRFGQSKLYHLNDREAVCKQSINGIDLKKYTRKNFKKNVQRAEGIIDYVMGIGLRTDYPARHYGNFINISHADEIYEYTIKMMKYLIG